MLARSNKTGADLKPAVVNAAMRTRGATQLTLPPLPATAAGEAFIDPGSMEADGAGDADCTLSGSHAAPGNGLIRALAFIDFYRAIVVAAAKAGEHPSTVKPEEPSRNVLESHILAVRQRIGMFHGVRCRAIVLNSPAFHDFNHATQRKSSSTARLITPRILKWTAARTR